MASASAANTSTKHVHVHVLNNDTFPTFVEAHSMALLSFFQSLSPRWKRFAPVFEQVVKNLSLCQRWKTDSRFADGPSHGRI
jgi:hypothetical protein